MRPSTESQATRQQPRLGPRVLVVEDSFMVATAIAGTLVDLGAEVVGPAATVSAAMNLLDNRGCDCAVLDINLGAETSESVACRLDHEQIPFIFVSGYQRPLDMLEDLRLRTRRLLTKPVDDEDLRRAIVEDLLIPARSRS